MLPAQHRIETRLDARVRRVFRWKADGALVDLTGWTGRFRIVQNDALVTEVPGAVTTGGTAGTVTLVIPAGTLTIPGYYGYNLDLIDPDTGLVPFVEGSLKAWAVYS